jgi:hypothetical protein
MAKRSPLRAKMHANRVKLQKRGIHRVVLVPIDRPIVCDLPADDPYVVERLAGAEDVRGKSQVRYKSTPKRARFESWKRAAIVRKHGLEAYEARLALGL